VAVDKGRLLAERFSIEGEIVTSGFPSGSPTSERGAASLRGAQYGDVEKEEDAMVEAVRDQWMVAVAVVVLLAAAFLWWRARR
jgi:hypothetical protein